MAERMLSPVESGIIPRLGMLSRLRDLSRDLSLFLDKQIEEWGGTTGFYDRSLSGASDSITVDDVFFDRGLTLIKRQLNPDGSQGPYRLDITRFPFGRRYHKGWGQNITQKEEGDWSFSDIREGIFDQPLTPIRKIAVVALLSCSKPVALPSPEAAELRQRYLQSVSHERAA